MNILSVVTAVSSVGLLLIVSSTQKDSISPKHISVKTILHWDQYATFQGKEKKIYIKLNKNLPGVDFMIKQWF